LTRTGNIRAEVLASFVRAPVARVTSTDAPLVNPPDPRTYESHSGHASGVNGLTGLLDSCGKLAGLIQTEAIPYRAEFHMIL
jgi:hypothetical protein